MMLADLLWISWPIAMDLLAGGALPKLGSGSWILKTMDFF
jgi:hypothetical protein